MQRWRYGFSLWGVTPSPLSRNVHAHMQACTHTHTHTHTFAQKNITALLLLHRFLSGRTTRWHTAWQTTSIWFPPETANHLTAFDPIQLYTVPQRY